MGTKKIWMAIALCSVFAVACGGSDKDEKTEYALCNADGSCADSNTVCINQYCLPRCSENSCGEGRVCGEDGICTAKKDDDPVEEPECSSTKKCADATKVCVDGHCVDNKETTSCKDDAACGEGKYCDAGSCIDKCTSSDACTDHRVCDKNGRCVPKCYTNPCPTGQACNRDGLCVEGECTGWQKCREVGYDDTYYCDETQFKCVKKCTAGSCASGEYCDAESGMCKPGECSDIDVCTGSKVCDLAKHTCIDKCTSNDSCGSGLLCDVDGRCVAPCSGGTCKNGKVCDNDTKLCIEAECSVLDACKINYQVCDAGVCKDRCTLSTSKCDDGYMCNEFSGLCVAKCTATSCTEAGQVCGNAGICVTGECSNVQPCADSSKVCSSSYECVEPKTVANECYFYSDCASACAEGADAAGCDKCKKSNKLCPEGKQCNAYNTCIDKATADGLGLGEPCDDADKKCASDLYCDPKKKYCVEAAFKVQGESCTPGAYVDHCDGNVIVECSAAYAQVMVYSCKTHYISWDIGTTGSFYGDDYVCAKWPNTNYVTCALQCTDEQVNESAERFVCGYDLDDPEIDYSDRFVCSYNSDGIAAYYQADSDACWNGCNLDNGKCDKF